MQEHPKDARPALNYGCLLRIWERDYGRESGWILKHHDKPVAELTDPQWEEMFWTSYRVTLLTDDPEMKIRVHSRFFWDRAEAEGYTLHNRQFDGVAQFGFPIVSPFGDDGRINTRGLYPRVDPPTAIDRIVLRIRRFFREFKKRRADA